MADGTHQEQRPRRRRRRSNCRCKSTPLAALNRFDGGRLPGPPDDRRHDAAGQRARVVDLEVVADDVGDAEVARHGFGVNGQRRRAHHYGVAALLMRAHHLVHAGEDPSLDVASKQRFPERVELRQGLAAQIAGGPDDEPLEFHAAHPVAHRRLEHAQHLADPGLTIADAMAGVDCRREPGDERAVQVEVGADVRTRGTCRELRQMHRDRGVDVRFLAVSCAPASWRCPRLSVVHRAPRFRGVPHPSLAQFAWRLRPLGHW